MRQIALTRAEIHKRITANEDKIRELRRENEQLFRQSLLLSDDKQWYTEKVEHHPKEKWQRQQHPLDGKVVGRINWKERIQDGDTGQYVEIERSQVVRVNGEWVI